MMRNLTPLVEPLSIDEAFMDLTGTDRLHGKSAARSLAELALNIEREIGITVSIGLSHNKFLAKIASDLDKPRGFSVIGPEETLRFLASQPVSLIWGVGKATQSALAKHGIANIAQLQRMERNDLHRRFGKMGTRLYHLARGQDVRRVSPDGDAKSISSETTFFDDITGRRGTEPDSLETIRKGLAPSQGIAHRRPDRRPQAQDGQVQDPHPQHDTERPDPDGRTGFFPLLTRCCSRRLTERRTA